MPGVLIVRRSRVLQCYATGGSFLSVTTYPFSVIVSV